MRHLASLALGILLAGPVQAFDLNDMTEAEQQAFNNAIREYLLEHPEVIFEAVDVYERRQAEAQAKNDIELIAANALELFDDGRSWVGGNPDGDITIVEFLDYKCGYCKKAFDDVQTLVETDGNIRFVVKEFPILGEESLLGARFAVAVRNIGGPDIYQAVHTELMTMRGAINEASLNRIAKAHDLDMNEIAVAMQSDEVTDELRANHALAQKLSINGTPGFVFQSEMMRGYAPLDVMLDVVDRVRG